MSRIFSLLSYETERFIPLKIQRAIGPSADCFKYKELTVQTGEGNGNPLQYSCLEYPMDRGAWRATVVGSQSVRHDLATKQQQQSGFKSVPSSHHGSQVS